jgi:hypothetical protein
LNRVMTGIIAFLIRTNAIFIDLYLSSQSEKTSSQSTILTQAKELESLGEKLDNQHTLLSRINSTVRTLTEENHNYAGLLSSYGIQIANFQT